MFKALCRDEVCHFGASLHRFALFAVKAGWLKLSAEY